MRNWFLALIAAPLFAWGQPGNNSGFSIEGKLDGYPEGTEIRLYRNGDNAEAANAILAKGKFALTGSVTEPMLCFLVIGNEKPVELYVENRAITIKGNKSKPGEFEVEGSPSHRDFASFIKVFLPLAQQLSSLATTINSTAPGKDRDGLMTNYNKTHETIQKEIDRFVIEKPSSHVSAFLLNATYQFNEDPVVLESRFNRLSEKIRSSEAGRQLASFISESKIGAVGTQSLDFVQPDTAGVPVSLSSFRGQYVLVDFWASWCGPCRDENPNVVKSYHQFKDKNFTVLGVSLDRPGQKEKWLRAIHDDKLTWTHVSDLKFWDNEAAQLYKIRGIPQNILVDPQGKIVAKNLRGPALEAKLCEILGCD